MSPPSSDGLAPFLRCRRPGLSPATPSETFEPSAPRRQLSGGSATQTVRGYPRGCFDGLLPFVLQRFLFDSLDAAMSRESNRKDLVVFVFRVVRRERLASSAWLRWNFCFGAEACVCQLRFCLLLKPEGFVLAVLLSWQRLHRPRMRCGSLRSKPASTSSMRSIGQWSAMVLGAPHRPWCLPHPSGPSPGQTHRGSLASTRARARRCAFDVYGLRPRVRRLSLAFLHSSHNEPEETRWGQPEVEHTLYINPPSSRNRGIGLLAAVGVCPL